MPALLLATLLQASAGAATASPPPLAAAVGTLLQADGPRAAAELRALPADSLTAKDAALRTCILQRLDEPSPSVDAGAPLSARVIALYRAYWREAAVHPAARDGAEQDLLQALGVTLGMAHPTWDGVEAALSVQLAREHLFLLGGRTGLLRELMVWAGRTEKTYDVKLPEGRQHTHVFFLDRFQSAGWARWLTCDRTGTGGWTRPEGLYVVASSYRSFKDETFRVNFLAHESQHFADQRRFPHLQAWEKEYRAKLVELVYADETRGRVLRSLEADQGDDPASPHSYADRRLLLRLRERLRLTADAALESTPGPELSAAARSELLADSARRRR